ncbi:MAG: FAD-dependent oxidoreductase [Armatimonadetes bacterium]|nr:FAD-dependent oxidoreductase [Armatimonadota bacterium]MDW8153837.1 FAD-dependent oxidoreductase [Armatimonadota bacterium]
MRERSPFYGICLCLVVGLFLTLPGRLAAQPRSLQVDLLVYGATPQGVTAAAAAALRGLRVLLAEPSEKVGGTFSQSWLNTLDLSRDREGRPLSGGLTVQFIQRLGSWDGVEVRRAEQVLRGMLSEASVVPRLGWRLVGVQVAHRRLETASFATPGGTVEVRATAFLDATDLATLAAVAGARFTVGREDTGLDRRQMAAGLIFRLAGLSWEKVGAAACPRRPCPTGNGRIGRLVWGFNDLAARYVPSDPGRFALRGLELALQDDGTVLVKGLQVFGVDATDAESLREAYLQAQAEGRRVVHFLRRTAPDLFGPAELVGVAPSLYIRESRHLVGLYRLRADDVLYGRNFPDALSLGGYPMDGQSYIAGEPPYLPGVPAPYGVPLRCLVPDGFTNLLVVSPAASFDSVAAFSARVVPLQMSLGEAAGIAVALARSMGRPLTVFLEDSQALRTLRRALLAAGIRLSAPRPPLPEDVLDPGYPEAVELLRRGLFNGSYRLRGGLHLQRSMSLREWMENLEHFLRARGTSTALETVLAVRSASYAILGYPLSVSSALSLLRALGLPGSVSTTSPYLTRGQGAILLWSAIRTSLPPVATQEPVRPPECREVLGMQVCVGVSEGRR